MGTSHRPHRRFINEARDIAKKYGHTLCPFDVSIRLMFPLYIATCTRCGMPAVVRPRPLLFEDRFTGGALTEICPRIELK